MNRKLHRLWTGIGLASLIGAGAVAPCLASFNSRSIGTTTANFLKLGVGGRCEAMGEACSALTDDASALYWNPAALTRIPEKEASLTLMHAPYLDPTYFDYAGYAQNTGRAGVFGLGVQYFSGGTVKQTDTSGAEVGSVNPYDMALSLGYARNFYDFGFGVTGKYIQSKLATSADATAVDMGILLPAFFNDRMRLSVVETNLGGRMTFDQQSYNLPFNLRFGSAYHVTGNWNATLDLNFPIDNDPYAAVGSEYLYKVRRGLTIAGRAGYNGRSASDVEGVTGVTAGFGVNLQNYAVDYAIVPMGALGLTHRISISLKFFGSEAPANTMNRPNQDNPRELDPIDKDLLSTQ